VKRQGSDEVLYDVTAIKPYGTNWLFDTPADRPMELVNGNYDVLVTATDGLNPISKKYEFTVDRGTLSIDDTPSIAARNDWFPADNLTIDFALNHPLADDMNLAIKIDGAAANAAMMKKSDVSYHAKILGQGLHTVAIDVTINDESFYSNTFVYKLDSNPPWLDLSSLATMDENGKIFCKVTGELSDARSRNMSR
jgi:hypothetical protein